MTEFKIKTNDELYEILGNVDKFNMFLTNFEENLTRKIMLSVPALVIHHIKNEQNYIRIKDKFFADNPELIGYKTVVAQQLNIVAAEHTDWTIEQVFNQSGIESKKIIRQMEETDGQKLQA